MAEAMRDNRFDSLLDEANETIRGIVKAKFRVSLNAADGGHENQNALQLCQDIFLELLEQLNKDEAQDKIKNIRNYAAVVSYHACAEHRRREFPEWYSLKNKLRYYLTERQGFAVWKDENEETVCGFASWENRANAAKVNEDIAESFSSNKNFARMNARDWEDLLDEMFKRIDAPIELDSLVNIVANLFGIKDEEIISTTRDDDDDPTIKIDLPSTALLPDKSLEIKIFLKNLWAAICDLKTAQRKVYLLNFTDADGDIQIFVVNGTATILEIGKAIEITDKEFEIIWNELSLREKASELKTYDERFVFLWLHLPLEDLLIAKMLETKRQNVITLRYRAKEAILKRLKKF
jgi:hypothetical protein